jgi:signal transduction histidine kinase/ActR/RegA family two-component response regulator
LSEPTLQLLNFSSERSKHDTKRLKDTVPLLIFLRDLTINTVFLSISVFILAILRQKWQPAAVGAVLLLLTVLCRAQILVWVRRQLLTRAVLFLAIVYLTVLFVAVLFIGDPLLLPLIVVQSFLPILLSVLYDLPEMGGLVIAVCGLYVLLIVGLLLPLPTHLPFNDANHLVLLVDVLYLGLMRILNTYRVIRWVLGQQAHENQRRLDMLQVLEADLKLRNAQLEQAARESDEANAAKTQFLQHMSHELRSPLNTVIGLSEIIAEDLEAFPPALVKEQARQIFKAGQHLLSVISDVLDIAKIESGTFQVVYEPVDLLTVINDLDAIIVGLKGRWPAVEFSMHLPESLPSVYAEDRRLRQIIINLLDNAFKYTREGNVALWVHEEPEGVLIAVEDNGIGIYPEDRTRIFEPFEQVAGRQSVGSGLGLAITRHLVLEHGGSLTVESEPGAGSTFNLFLPRMELVFPEQGSGTILIVDSDKNFQIVIKHQLTCAGYTVLCVNAPDEARKLLGEQPVDGVVLDVSLPTEDIGWQFVLELVGPKALQNIPVLIYSSLPTRIWAQELPISYLEKPARPSVLVSTLQMLLMHNKAAVK